MGAFRSFVENTRHTCAKYLLGPVIEKLERHTCGRVSKKHTCPLVKG